MNSHELNEEQKKSIEYEGAKKAILILAGAGSGKTTVVSKRIEFLIEKKKIPSERILMLSFTNRGIDEMNKKIAEFEMKAVTFDSFAQRMLLKNHKEEFGIEGSEFAPPLKQNEIMRKAIKEYETQYERQRKEKAKQQKDKIDAREKDCTQEYQELSLPSPKMIIGFKSYLMNTCNGQIRDEIYHNCKEHIDEIIGNYNKEMKKMKLLDFSDITSLLVEKMENDGKIKKIFTEKYDYVIVDEMQDTSPLQMKLLNFFNNQEICLFCVGDPAQSIFSFQGADYRNIMDFTNNFKNSEIIELKKNYRSSPEILDMSNNILKKSDVEYTSDFTATKKPCGKKPLLIQYKSEQAQINYIENDINNKIKNGDKHKDMMIVCRTRKESFMFQAEFIVKNIRFTTKDSNKIHKQKLFEEFLFSIKIIANQELSEKEKKDNGYLIKILKEQKIDEKNIQNEFEKNPNLENYMNILWDTFLPLIKKKHGYEWEEEGQCLLAIRRLLMFYETPNEFIKIFGGKTCRIRNSKNGVSISTVHGAKGAECKNCYVINADTATYPNFRNIKYEDLIEEDRRILYVAVTRAMENLIITYRHTIKGDRFIKLTNFMPTEISHLAELEIIE